MLTRRKEGAEELEALSAKKPSLKGLGSMRTSSKIALGILAVVVILSVLASVIAPFDPMPST